MRDIQYIYIIDLEIGAARAALTPHGGVLERLERVAAELARPPELAQRLLHLGARGLGPHRL